MMSQPIEVSRCLWASLVLALSCWCNGLAAQVPHKIGYQGYLSSATGGTPVNGTVSMQLKLYDVSSGGTALHSEAQSVVVSNGVFNVVIGTSPVLTLPFDVPYYLGVTVGADAEMTPRHAIASSPYSLRTASVDATAALPAAQITGTLGTAQIANGAVTTAKLAQSGCSAGQVLKWSGSAWGCANDTDTVGVTSITAGTGLTGGVITGVGTIAADSTYLQRRVSGTCAAGTFVRSVAADGTVTCGADANSGGTVTSITAGAGLSGGTVTGIGTIALDPASSTLTANFYKQGGNAFAGAPVTLGTTNGLALDLVVNGNRALRLEPNAVSPNVIGGNPSNGVTAGVRGATIGGGGAAAGNSDPDFLFEGPNTVTDAYGTVAGGYANRAGDNAGTAIDQPFATVGGGAFNVAARAYSTVAGGGGNAVNGTYSSIGGGELNISLAATHHVTIAGGQSNSGYGNFSTIGGGTTNNASGESSTVGGGSNNAITVPASFATIAGGSSNQATAQYASVGGGYSNKARGLYSTVPGGWGAFADGALSMALGYLVQADQDHCFVFGGWTSLAGGRGNCLGTTSIARFMFDHGLSIDYYSPRMDGGGTRWIYFGDLTPGQTIQVWNGAHLTDGGTWTDNSDRDTKRDFVPVEPREVLQRVARLPISTWSYRNEEASVRHMGTMAQAFHAEFGLGADDRHIAPLDTGGVALAAIQGLHRIVQEKSREIARLKARITKVDTLEKRLLQLEAKLARR